MKVKKAKNIRKYLRFYKIIFGINPPYHVILDGNFVFAALKYKLPLLDRLRALLQDSEFRVYSLQSAYDELVKAGPSCKESVDFIKANCIIIDDKAAAGANAGEKLIAFLEQNIQGREKGDKSCRNYFVATQDRETRLTINHLPGIPTMYLSQVVLVMEAPSETSKSYNKRIELHKDDLNEAETKALAIVNKSLGVSEAIANTTAPAAAKTATAAPTPRIKRKAQAANPLSCLPAQEDSQKSKKIKVAKYKRR